MPAISLNKAPDPLFLIAGGPGTSAVDLYTSSAAPFDRVRRDRDIVLLDQRGTGRSHRLDCNYEDQDVFERFDDVEVGPENIKCRDELSKTPICACTPPASRSRISTRCARRWAMNASISMAARTARAWRSTTRAVIRSRTRTLILDGVVNPEIVLGPAIAIDAERALERILARCKADASCAKAFTDPIRRLPGAARPARAKAGAAPWSAMRPPAGLSSFDFTARHLSAVLRFASYNDDQAALLPLSLHLAVHEENFMPLANQFRVFARSLGSGFAYGMHNSVACSEDAPLIDAAKLDLPALNATHMGAEQVQQLIEACRDWPKGVVDPDLHAPFKSDAAALLLSGADDPVTPPEYAALAQRAFADSKHVIIAATATDSSSAPCVDRVIARFHPRGQRQRISTRPARRSCRRCRSSPRSRGRRLRQ